MRVSASGGTAVPVTARDRSRGETLHVAPMLLPDHRHFLYLRRSASQENGGIYVGSLDAKPEQQSTKQILATDLGAIFVPGATTRDSGHLLFLREGTLLAQTFDIQKLELTGEPTPVAEHVGTYSSLGQFSAASNSVLIYRVGGSAEERLTWYDSKGMWLAPSGTLASIWSSRCLPTEGRWRYPRSDPETGISGFSTPRGGAVSHPGRAKTLPPAGHLTEAALPLRPRAPATWTCM